MICGLFWRDTRGTAGAEFALVLPILLTLLYGSFEGGNFIWTQHKLINAVRDGARYASRLDINAVCGSDPAVLAAVQADVRLLTRTGQLADASAPARVAGWRDDQVSVTFACGAFVDTGIYDELGQAGPIVAVAATGVPYRPLFGGLGAISPIMLGARSNAVVTGL